MTRRNLFAMACAPLVAPLDAPFVADPMRTPLLWYDNLSPLYQRHIQRMLDSVNSREPFPKRGRGRTIRFYRYVPFKG